MNQRKRSKRAMRYVCSVLTCIMILTLSAGMASSQTYAMSENVNGGGQNQTINQPSSEVPVTESQVPEASPVSAPSTEIPTTEVPATEVPTTEVPTTEVPTTEIPTTEVPTSEVPATEVPVTEAPVTEVPSTEIPATESQPAQIQPTEEITSPAVATDISFIDVNLQGREFSTTASVGAPPYYQVFRFTTPEGGGGSYTFYTEYINDIVIDSYAYLCTESQYRDLCNRIETQQYRVSVTPEQCLAYNDDGGVGYNFYINYNLEPGTTYYFIGTRYSSRYVGDYKLVFMRDIQLNLDNQGAEVPGSDYLYSKGNLWYPTSSRTGESVTSITVPQKTGYIFKGYYTEANGSGTQIISDTGNILDAVSAFSLNTTLYASWESVVVPEGTLTGSVDNENPALQINMENEIGDLRDKVLTEEQKQRITNGENGKIYLKIQDLQKSVSKEDKKRIKEKLNGYKAGRYLDLTLWSQIGNDADQKVANTNGKIKISLKVPEDLPKKESGSSRSYRIIRIHDGKASVLKTDYSKKTKTLRFETDKFSIYAITYKDTQNQEAVPAVEPAPVPAQPAAAEVTTISAKDDVPKTGDQDYSWLYLIGMVCFSGGTVFFGSRAHRKTK